MRGSFIHRGIRSLFDWVTQHVIHSHRHFYDNIHIALYYTLVIYDLYVLCLTLPVYHPCVAHFFFADYDLL